MSWASPTRTWQVRFLGDPDIGRNTWDGAGYYSAVVEATDASTAARKALSQWRKNDAAMVRDEGWYGEGTVLGVQEVVEPPQVKEFVVRGGRPKLDRQGPFVRGPVHAR